MSETPDLKIVEKPMGVAFISPLQSRFRLRRRGILRSLVSNSRFSVRSNGNSETTYLKTMLGAARLREGKHVGTGLKKDGKPTTQ